MNILLTIGLILFLIGGIFLAIVSLIILLAMTIRFIDDYRDKPKSKNEWKIN